MRVFAVAAVLVGLVAAQANAQELTVKNATVIVTAANPKDVRVVGTVSNPSMYSSYLVAATSEAAERVEFRDARKKDARVAEVEVPAFGALSLEAKGVYLALVNPKKRLARGAQVVVILSNDAQAKIRMTAVVGP